MENTPPDGRASNLEVRAAMAQSRRLCGRGAIVGLAPDSGKAIVIPATCKSWACPKCRPLKISHWSKIVQAGKPERFITLTIDTSRFGSPRAAALAAVKAWKTLVHAIRRKCASFQYVRFFELHKSGWPHLHIVQRGSYIPQAWLSNLWDKLGMGKVIDIRRVYHPAKAAHYMTKYVAKSAGGTADTLQGIRLVSKSNAWVLDQDEANPPKATEGYEWHFVQQPYWQVLAALADWHVFTSGLVGLSDGLWLSCEYTRRPRGRPPDLPPSLSAALEARARPASA